MSRHIEAVRPDLIVTKTKISNLPHRKAKKVYSPNYKGTLYTANPEVRAWLNQMTKAHWFFFTHAETRQLMISFCSNDDAMLFKLTWH